MAITTESGLIAAMPGQVMSALKVGGTGKGAGTWHSHWTIAGSPGAGAAQGTANGAILTSATAGAFLFTNPVSPALTYVARLAMASTQQTHVLLYDRLWHNSALSGIVATAQAITQPALTRWTGGDGVQIWVEIYTATGVTAANITASYTNQAGTAARTTASIAFPVSPVAGQCFPLPLQAGDTGVRSVQSATLSISTGTAGNFGLFLAKPTASFPLQANTGLALNAYDLGMPQVQDNACLAMATLLPGTVVPALQGEFSLAQG